MNILFCIYYLASWFISFYAFREFKAMMIDGVGQMAQGGMMGMPMGGQPMGGMGQQQQVGYRVDNRDRSQYTAVNQSTRPAASQPASNNVWSGKAVTIGGN